MDAVIERAWLDLVAPEASLLDAGRLDERLALFAEDGRRSVPLQGAAPVVDGGRNSLTDEDLLLLAPRIEQPKNPRAHSPWPPSRCQHVLQQRTLVHAGDDAGRYEMNTPFVYIETRGEQHAVLGGSLRHSLVRGADGTRIELKRIELLNAGAALPAIRLFP